MTTVCGQRYIEAFTLTKHTQKRFNTHTFFRCYAIDRDKGIVCRHVPTPHPHFYAKPPPILPTHPFIKYDLPPGILGQPKSIF